MKFLTRKGYLIEEQGMTYLGDTGPETALGPRRAGGLHLPHCAGAPGRPESAELPNHLDTRAATDPRALCQRAGPQPPCRGVLRRR
jgi:hypothetical protein